MAQLLENGVDEEVLHGMLVSKQFQDLMGLDASSVYLGVSQNMAVYWSIFGDRDAWKKSADFENRRNDFLTVGYMKLPASTGLIWIQRCWLSPFPPRE